MRADPDQLNAALTLVYRFRIKRLDGAVAGNKRASCCGAAHPRPGHAEATPGRFAIRHVDSQTDR